MEPVPARTILRSRRATLSATREELGLEGPQRVRDLWRQEDLGIRDGSLALSVSRHGVALVRLWPAG